MSRTRRLVALIILAAVLVPFGSARAVDPPVPRQVSYQGEIQHNGAPYHGLARFKFAFVDSSRNIYYWSNDGTVGIPAGGVGVDVDRGLFTVMLGAPPMSPIDPYSLGEFLYNQALRIWVDVGDGYVLLGDQPLASSLFALKADAAYSARTSPGTFVSEGQIHAKAGGFKFPDGTVQTTASSGGGGTGGNTLDEAYDEGGPGAGATIVADAGPVIIGGTAGLKVSDKVFVGTTGTGGPLQVRNVGSTNGSKILSFAESTLPIFYLESGFASSFASSTYLNFRTYWAPSLTMDGDGQVGVGLTGLPEAPLHLAPGNWDLVGTNGDFLIGDSNYKFKIGMATSGGGAGNVHIRSVGGSNQLVLGGGTKNVLWVGENGVRVTEGPFQVTSTGRVITPAVQITGGADLSESFDVTDGARGIEPGSVLVIDPDNPGQLALSRDRYDTRVAGVVSGAGGVNPGLSLTQEGVLEGAEQVALTGRVYVRACTENGAIEPGDMLTTSSRAGVAMKATDRSQAYGAVLGKAMTRLDGDDGLVLVLIGLQ